MKSGYWKIVFLLQALKDDEHGQDLVEYALVVALISLGGFAGIETLARAILSFFQGVISTINSNFA